MTLIGQRRFCFFANQWTCFAAYSLLNPFFKGGFVFYFHQFFAIFQALLPNLALFELFCFGFWLFHMNDFLVALNGCTYEYSPPVEPFVRGLWGVSLRKCFVLRFIYFFFLFFIRLIGLSNWVLSLLIPPQYFYFFANQWTDFAAYSLSNLFF